MSADLCFVIVARRNSVTVKSLTEAVGSSGRLVAACIFDEDVDVTITKWSWSDLLLDGTKLCPGEDDCFHKKYIAASSGAERKLILKVRDGKTSTSQPLCSTPCQSRQAHPNRTGLIVGNQNLSNYFPDPHKVGAFVVPDNQLDRPVTRGSIILTRLTTHSISAFTAFLLHIESISPFLTSNTQQSKLTRNNRSTPQPYSSSSNCPASLMARGG